jgi:hypothetical protein
VALGARKGILDLDRTPAGEGKAWVRFAGDRKSELAPLSDLVLVRVGAAGPPASARRRKG